MNTAFEVALILVVSAYLYLSFVAWAVRRAQVRISRALYRFDALAARHDLTESLDTKKLREMIIGPGLFAPGLVFGQALHAVRWFVERRGRKLPDGNSPQDGEVMPDALWKEYDIEFMELSATANLEFSFLSALGTPFSRKAWVEYVATRHVASGIPWETFRGLTSSEAAEKHHSDAAARQTSQRIGSLATSDAFDGLLALHHRMV